MSMQIDDFKNCLSYFGSGVTVITYLYEGKFEGLTVSSFTSVSIEPPLILFCIQKTSQSHEKIQHSGSFAVNILSSEQENLSNSFAKKDTNKHELILQTNFFEKSTKSPILQGSLGFLDCKLENFYDGGDHSIVIGRVLDLGTNTEKKPLIYYNRKYYSL